RAAQREIRIRRGFMGETKSSGGRGTRRQSQFELGQTPRLGNAIPQTKFPMRPLVESLMGLFNWP
ncbi:MAG TPA: hypothetical protein VHC95_08905, partial [Opitutales bacterium]|nr:hypothetical protein [Opitutales bacterium]